MAVHEEARGLFGVAPELKPLAAYDSTPVHDAVLEALPETPSMDDGASGGPRRVAIVGKPNVGKSSLLNQLAGEDRVVVDNVAGTTVDPVDELIELGGKTWRFVDTAGGTWWLNLKAVYGLRFDLASAEPRLAATVPPWVPEQALSVPVLPLVDGKELRIGDSVSAVAERLGRAAESGRQEVDRGPNGERLTRFYEYSGSRFILVFEPLEQAGESKLAAIYVTGK